LRERLANRLLGVGLAAGLAAVTLALALTGRLGLYINPDSTWFAVTMAVLALVGAAVSFALPLGAEADHGHDHGDADETPREPERPAVAPRRAAAGPGARRALGAVGVAIGGVLATGVVATVLLVPPAALSADIAISRNTGSAPLFQGADTVALAATGDTAAFGVGEWASVFATATNPEVFDGDEVTLTGFVTPGGGSFGLTRLVITHCVIDAQSATVPIVADGASADVGEWVTVTGTIRDVDGRLQILASSVDIVNPPEDPYEY
jgi:uncharacterized repeat protein (TIGR03943 family)